MSWQWDALQLLVTVSPKRLLVALVNNVLFCLCLVPVGEVTYVELVTDDSGRSRVSMAFGCSYYLCTVHSHPVYCGGCLFLITERAKHWLCMKMSYLMNYLNWFSRCWLLKIFKCISSSEILCWKLPASFLLSGLCSVAVKVVCNLPFVNAFWNVSINMQFFFFLVCFVFCSTLCPSLTCCRDMGKLISLCGILVQFLNIGSITIDTCCVLPLNWNILRMKSCCCFDFGISTIALWLTGPENNVPLKMIKCFSSEVVSPISFLLVENIQQVA